MKKIISVLLLALASVCAVNAQTRDTVLVDGLYYILVTYGAIRSRPKKLGLIE